MFLAFKITDIITIPCGWILGQLYQLTGNYGIALALFAVGVYMVLLPVTAKSKKNTMKMSRMAPLQKAIQERYANDPNRQNQAIQELYKQEGVSLYGSCLWSLLPLLILIPLLTVIRQPITYVLGESAEVAEQIVAVIKAAAPEMFSSNSYYDQVIATQAIPQFAEQIKAVLPDISAVTLEGINFNVLGINMGSVPSFNIFGWEAFDWAHIGLFLVPCLSAGTQVLQMWITQKMNNSIVTNEKGIQDEEAAKNSQAAQTNKTMMLMGPLMSLWIGFTVPAALSLYWFVGGLVRTIQDVILTHHYRKIYDAEDAVRLQKAMEQEAIEAEKERVRAERRAANPEGITANTSKKKLQKAEKEKNAAAKAAAAKEYAAKKGIVEEEKPVKEVMSGIPERPYCKGRAYVANRYGNTEE